jgi:hypothetical protein
VNQQIKALLAGSVLALALCAANVGTAEVLKGSDASFFGYMIVVDASCGTRQSTLDLAGYLSKGVTLKDFKALKPEIVQGKELARADIAADGKEAYCQKHRPLPDSDVRTSSIPNHEKDAESLGSVTAQDELCGTHSYIHILHGVKKSGGFYPALLKDYAEEFEEGKGVAVSVFKSEGETKYCRFERNREREDAEFKSFVRALGVYEPPSYDQ